VETHRLRGQALVVEMVEMVLLLRSLALALLAQVVVAVDHLTAGTKVLAVLVAEAMPATLRLPLVL
jgi:hypothetical protein